MQCIVIPGTCIWSLVYNTDELCRFMDNHRSSLWPSIDLVLLFCCLLRDYWFIGHTPCPVRMVWRKHVITAYIYHIFYTCVLCLPINKHNSSYNNYSDRSSTDDGWINLDFYPNLITQCHPTFYPSVVEVEGVSKLDLFLCCVRIIIFANVGIWYSYCVGFGVPICGSN